MYHQTTNLTQNCLIKKLQKNQELLIEIGNSELGIKTSKILLFNNYFNFEANMILVKCRIIENVPIAKQTHPVQPLIVNG